MHCDPHVEGKPWPYAPRIILKSLIQRAADAGFEPWVGAEVEYFLLTRNADGSLATADAADTAAQPCYDARGVTRMYEHLTTISTAMNTLGWSNYANDHEDGNGQFEQEVRLRRSAHHRRPGGDAALPVVDDRRRTRDDRDVHAQAFR